MAKIRIHELAKELDKQSKDILSYLQEKGVEVKSASSSVEEDIAENVRNAFGGKAAKTEAAGKKEERSDKAEEKSVKAAEKPAETEKKAEAEKAQPVKSDASQPKAENTRR